MARILWIDENSGFVLRFLLDDLVEDGQHQADAVASCSEAVNLLLTNHYDVVIIEPIGLCGGDDGREWNQSSDWRNSYLCGCELLRSLLSPSTARVKLDPLPDLSNTRIGILSTWMRKEVQEVAKELGIRFRGDKIKDLQVDGHKHLRVLVDSIMAVR